MASWACLCPGNDISANKRRSGKTRRGNNWLRTALVEAAWAAFRAKDTYLSSQFHRLQPPRRQARRRSRGPFHLDCGLSPPGQARSGLHRTRWRLLPETQSGAGTTPSRPEARRTGVHRHADPSRHDCSFGCQISHQSWIGGRLVSTARRARVRFVFPGDGLSHRPVDLFFRADANIKLAAVATDSQGVSARAISRRSSTARPIRRSWPNWRRAACGPRFRSGAGVERAGPGAPSLHVAGGTRTYRRSQTRLLILNARIRDLTAPYESTIQRLDAIPGVDRYTAEVILAEIGPNVKTFPTAKHLASWACLCPGNDISANKRRSGKTRRGNNWLRTASVEAAWAASRAKDTYLSSQFRLQPPRQQARRSSRGPFHLDCGLSPPGQARSGLHRTRWRLLPETQSGAGATPSRPEARRTGVHRHADPSRRNCSFGCLISHQSWIGGQLVSTARRARVRFVFPGNGRSHRPVDLFFRAGLGFTVMLTPVVATAASAAESVTNPGLVAVSSARPVGHVSGLCSLETVSATVQWICFSGQGRGVVCPEAISCFEQA